MATTWCLLWDKAAIALAPMASPAPFMTMARLVSANFLIRACGFRDPLRLTGANVSFLAQERSDPAVRDGMSALFTLVNLDHILSAHRFNVLMCGYGRTVHVPHSCPGVIRLLMVEYVPLSFPSLIMYLLIRSFVSGATESVDSWTLRLRLCAYDGNITILDLIVLPSHILDIYFGPRPFTRCVLGNLASHPLQQFFVLQLKLIFAV